MSQPLRPVSSLHSDGSQRQGPGMGPETKPLPRLPHGWSRICHETGLFLRSIGLGILVTAFQGCFTANFLEPEKVAIRKSRVTALLRALIHALPLGLAIFEIYLNWKGHYVGVRFERQNYLQFAAKAHEILMQASIATIILSYVRYQISAGKGMPFGAILGALQFFQVSYLWSIEFLSAIMSKDFRLRKKICFAVLVLICVTIASTAGPSSANLLIARQGIWPNKSNYLAINATFLDMWPDRLDDEKISSDCKMVRIGPTSFDDGCPVSAVYGLDGYMIVSNFMEQYDRQSGQLIELSSPRQDFFTRSMIFSPCLEGFKDQVCSTVQQDVFLDRMIENSESHLQEDTDKALQGYHVLGGNYYQPYTTASCITDTVQNSSDQMPLQFVHLSDTASGLKNGPATFSVPGLTKGQSIDIPGNITQFRVNWVDLPHEVSGSGVPGAIIVHPQSSINSWFNITTCTLNAGWGSSSVFTHKIEPANLYSHMTQLPPSWSTNRSPLPDPYSYVYTEAPIFSKKSNFSYPQLRINISESWMEFVNPTFIKQDNSTTNAVSMLLSQLSSQPKDHELAWALNFFFVTALSSTGMELDAKVFEERTSAIKSCETCLVFEISNLMYGWQYTARETTTKLATAVMLIYCILVLGHLIYSAISGVSSTAWDSVAELVALAMNSSPTKSLQNTCAGIVGRIAYETRVRVLQTSEKHLELVFGEFEDPNADISKLVMNEKYGSIAEGKKDAYKPFKMEGQARLRRRASF